MAAKRSRQPVVQSSSSLAHKNEISPHSTAETTVCGSFFWKKANAGKKKTKRLSSVSKFQSRKLPSLYPKMLSVSPACANKTLFTISVKQVSHRSCDLSGVIRKKGERMQRCMITRVRLKLPLPFSPSSNLIFRKVGQPRQEVE